MSDDDVSDNSLRVGGWLPSYDPPGRHLTPQPVTDPPARSTSGRSTGAPPIDLFAVGPATAPTRRPIALAGLVALSLVVLVTAGIGRRDGAGPLFGDAPAVPAVGPSAAAVSENQNGAPGSPSDPAPSGSADPATGPLRTAGRAVPRNPLSDPVRVPPPAPHQTRTEPPTVDTGLTVGTRVGLAPASQPGLRVRHRDFVGRVDAIGPTSGVADRADSTFAVRAGLADPRCVSFESVNFPGYFLRHQNFQLLLHQRDGSGLFAADATFCPVTGLSGQHTSFRSLNFPDRYLRHREQRIYLDPIDGSAATRAAATFAVRPGLG